MKTLKRIVLGLLAVAALLVLAFVAVQTWYHFTPVELSAEAKALNERAAKLPTVTENGYRLYGIEAPRELDAVAYGRCLVDAHWASHKAEEASGVRVPDIDAPGGKAAYDAYWTARSARWSERSRACAKGGEPLQLPKAVQQAKIDLKTSRADFARIAGERFDPVILGRAEQVWTGDARRLGTSFEAPMLPFSTLVAVERWRIANAAITWDSGQRSAAATSWAGSVRAWMKSADDTLIDSMLSINLLTQTLIAIQQSAAQAPMLDEASAKELLTALTPIEAMPHALSDALLAEWQVSLEAVELMNKSRADALAVASAREQTISERIIDVLGRATFDRNDTINHMARGMLWSQRAVLKAAQGEPGGDSSPDFTGIGCAIASDYGFACMFVQRNPGGRIGALIAAPMYKDYGIRVADLMTLLNATRLTIRARQLGLTGAALEKWVAEAPPELRDISSKQPFRYDANERKLYVELRARSTVLGDKGSYSLPL